MMSPFNLGDQPPAYVAPADLQFFTRYPDRRYRARRPFRSELERLGTIPTLTPGQDLVVVASRLGAGHIMTALYKFRLDPPGRLPRTDGEIHGAFTARANANIKETVDG